MTDNKTRRLSVVRTSPDTLRLGQGEQVHVGVDVHKATYHVAISSGSRGLLATWVQPAHPEVLVERLRPIQGQVAGVVSEAGPTGFGLIRRLCAAGLPAQVIATSKVLAPVGPEAKSDRLDREMPRPEHPQNHADAPGRHLGDFFGDLRLDFQVHSIHNYVSYLLRTGE